MRYVDREDMHHREDPLPACAAWRVAALHPAGAPYEPRTQEAVSSLPARLVRSRFFFYSEREVRRAESVMDVVMILVVGAVLLLAYSNGANDNFKGVATLFGSGTTTYPVALGWATLTTFLGCLVALWLASGLVETFRGKGLVPDEIAAHPPFLLAVALGAAGAVLIATWLGLPVSTTHALTGGLVGAGLVLASSDVRLSKLGSSILLPLFTSPLLALSLTFLAYPALRRGRRASGLTLHTCICIDGVTEPTRIEPDGSVCLLRTGVTVVVDQAASCRQHYEGRLVGIEMGRLLDGVHFLSAGAVGFARGLNDTPKLVALLLIADVVPVNVGLWLVSVVMAVGGLVNARRVAETMSRKITPMSPGQGLTANLVTALLVTVASRLGLPVSTTHVSVGSLFGIGMVTRKAHLSMVVTILLAWATTLPLSAVLAATVA
jgi:PiT family inorganic phosphate transporter